MVKRVSTILVDDLDGTVIEADGAGGRVPFGIDGRSYEIDLTPENAAALRELIRPYAVAGRRTRRNKSNR